MDHNDDIFDIGIKSLALNVSPDAKKRMGIFLDLLLERNMAMNLTAILDKKEAISRHLIDSLAVLRAVPIEGKKLIDIGCGAGFPGMPLKLYDPAFDITLLDSQKKRIDFLKEACAALAVAPPLICARAEEAANLPTLREQFDIAVARAVAPLNILCELSLPFVRTGGIFLAMKMSDCGDELRDAERAIKMLGGSVTDFFDYSLPLGNLSYRIICIKKLAATSSKYPRRFSKIKSHPL